MKRFVKFWNLPAMERRLLVSALFCLAAIRIGLWVLPLQQLLKRLETLKVSKTFRVWDPPPAERIAWAIRVAGRYLPGGGNCLVQSLAAQTMLARRGYPARLRIGVAKDEGGRLKAHAWVECEGNIVIGSRGMSQYTPFPYLEVCRR